MKRKKNLLILLIAVVLIGIIALLVALKGSKKATFEQDFHVADTETITKIFLADKQNNQVLLERVADADSTADTTWTVDGIYPVNKGMMRLLLETLHDMRIRQQVQYVGYFFMRQATINAFTIKTFHSLRIFPSVFICNYFNF